jgi:hypothetical protein
VGDPRGTQGHTRHDVHDDRSLGVVHTALRLRLGLAVFGLLASIAGLLLVTVVTRQTGWTVFFAVLVAVTALNVAVVAVRLAQVRRERDRGPGGGNGNRHEEVDGGTR